MQFWQKTNSFSYFLKHQYLTLFAQFSEVNDENLCSRQFTRLQISCNNIQAGKFNSASTSYQHKANLQTYLVTTQKQNHVAFHVMSTANAAITTSPSQSLQDLLQPFLTFKHKQHGLSFPSKFTNKRICTRQLYFRIMGDLSFTEHRTNIYSCPTKAFYNARNHYFVSCVTSPSDRSRHYSIHLMGSKAKNAFDSCGAVSTRRKSTYEMIKLHPVWPFPEFVFDKFFQGNK